MAYRWKNTLTSEDVTPYSAYVNRRQLMAGAAAGAILGTLPAAGRAEEALVWLEKAYQQQPKNVALLTELAAALRSAARESSPPVIAGRR